MPRVAKLLADQFRAAGIADADIHFMPYEALPGDQTEALIVRWRSPHATKKPMLILGHMDVVEAKRDRLEVRSVRVSRGGWLFPRPGHQRHEERRRRDDHGRGQIDERRVQARPRHHLLLQRRRGDARRWCDAGFDQMAQSHRRRIRPQCRRRLRLVRSAIPPLGCHISIAEKTFQTYFLTTRNPGGHSSRPRPDNAIYDLADALEKLRKYRFGPMQNDANRGYFEERAKQEGNSLLGQAIRRWLANPNDGEAADIVEASPLDVGLTRTRCVATMLSGGHADNALPQSATATVNCRIFPGVQPAVVQGELQELVGPKVEVKPDPEYAGVPTPSSPLRPDVLAAVTKAIQRFHGPQMHVFPVMSAGASDGCFFRAQGIPVYDVDGSWGISPLDDREHGLDERIPVRSMYDDVLYWEMIIKALAG